jgi:hypothetical protein
MTTRDKHSSEQDAADHKEVHNPDPAPQDEPAARKQGYLLKRKTKAPDNGEERGRPKDTGRTGA